MLVILYYVNNDASDYIMLIMMLVILYYVNNDASDIILC